MILGRDTFRHGMEKTISWSLTELSMMPALTTCLACEVRVTSKRGLDLVGEAINCDKLNNSQKAG